LLAFELADVVNRFEKSSCDAIPISIDNIAIPTSLCCVIFASKYVLSYFLTARSQRRIAARRAVSRDAPKVDNMHFALNVHTARRQTETLPKWETSRQRERFRPSPRGQLWSTAVEIKVKKLILKFI